MTPEERIEWVHRFEERVGLIANDGVPIQRAIVEARHQTATLLRAWKRAKEETDGQ